VGAYEEFEAGMEQARQGHYEAAIERFKAAIEQTTDEKTKREVWWNVSICHMRLGQIEEAQAAAAVAGRTAAADDELIETWADLHEAGAGDAAALGFELRQAGDNRGALAAFEAALHDPDLDDDTRGYLYGRIALCHLDLLDWGRAEEAAAAMRESDRAEYDRRRAELMAEHKVSPADLPGYDGSDFDDEFTRAKARYDAGDYTGALEILDRIVGPTIDRGSFGEEVWLYVALANLRAGKTDAADGYAAFLTGTWADAYHEQRTALHPG
jgi:tetratricopeptide (TPR) repeat protein